MNRVSGASRPLRVAIVGCGAVTERLHVPALAGSTMLRVSALVDPDASRLAAISALTGPTHTAASIEGLAQHADLAIVAVPHHLHLNIAVALMEQGLHVLIEKPLATSQADAQTLIETSNRTRRHLCVGLIRRHYVNFEFVKHILTAGWIGPVQSFDLREGGVFGWPVVSAFPFRREHGGGVLMDTGAHSLDMVLAWLGPFRDLTYRDDADGGVEANAILEMTLESGATGTVELSRTRGLRNTCIIRGTKGEIEVGLGPNASVILSHESLRIEGTPTTPAVKVDGIHAADRRQLEAFADAIMTGATPALSAAAVVESVRAFDRCREVRAPLDQPWAPFDGTVAWPEFDGRTVLVLGGTGFLGGRVVEALAQRSRATVRVLARDYARLSSVARFPVEFIRGDVGDPKVLGEALRGCDVVINCTYGKGPPDEQTRVNVEAVETLLRSAAAAGVRRIVHTSTVSVYGLVAEGTIHEALTDRAPRREVYGHTKARGEQLALTLGKELGLQVVVLQPGAIYGPGAPTWTQNQLRLMSAGRIVLVDEGQGASNAIYVDDVVTAILTSAVGDGAGAERFLIGGPQAVTWKDFFECYSRMLGGGRTINLSDQELAAARKLERKRQGTVAQIKELLRQEYRVRPQLIEVPVLAAVRNLVRRSVPRSMIEDMKQRVIASGPQPESSSRDRPLLPSVEQIAFFRARGVIDDRKARRHLGYEPTFDLARGMEMTEAWAKWANLI